MTTKEQERKALEKIKKIVVDLGPDSYVAIAFSGCFEDAEKNINNDFACSMQNRYEVWFAKAGELDEENKRLKKDLAREKDRANKAETRYNELKKAQLSPDDLFDFAQMLSDSICECDQNMQLAAETIIKMADTPTDIAFQNAVKIHRRYQQKRQYFSDIMDRVQRAKKEAEA